MSTRGNVSFFGILGYELDLKHLLPIETKEIINQIKCYKQYRQIFQFGIFRRIRGGWQVSGHNKVLAVQWRKLVHAAPRYEQLRLKGLDSRKRYHLHSASQKLRVGQFGALVKHIAPISIDPNGWLLRTVDRHYALDDGTQDLTVSGQALMAGIPLLPGFRGTGYDKNQRTQGDFSSGLYIAEEEKT